MIEQLTVKDYILFDNSHVDFDNSMSVITGETGAGKSLLIDAIAALSGGRISSGVVRKGSEKAVLEMVLSNPSEEVEQLLEENGFDREDTLVITRIIQASGKSRILLNSRVTTNSFVQSIVSKMIDVHSQMDTIKLNDPSLQLELLDKYAGNQQRLEQTEKAYKAYADVYRRQKKMQNETFSDDQLEFITAQLNEINNAAIQPGEQEKLQEQIALAQSVARSMEDLDTALMHWNKDGGLQEMLFEDRKNLLHSSAYESYGTQINDLYYALADVYEQLHTLRRQAAVSGADLDEMQEREFLIRKLIRKYGGSYESLQKKKQELEEQVDRILHRQDVFDRLEKEKRQAWKEYVQADAELEQARMAVKEELCRKIEAHGRDLMLSHLRFDIRFVKGAPSARGSQSVEFYASMNPGSDLTPLKQSASGGELSRLMLALKVVFQAQNGITTLIFDEIDTGVSGKVALSMGSKMHALAEKYQVLCITHLPSVAVWADDHYRVEKQAKEDSTTTQISRLDENEHLEELAIMANGTATESAVASMRELAAQIRHG